MSKLMENLSRILKNNPDRMFEIVEELFEKYGDEIEMFFTSHIENQSTYDKFISVIKNFDGSKGGHWSVEQIKEVAKINFDEKPYTCYDFAYVMNMRYSDDGQRMNTDYLIASAKDYLEDVDYWGDPSTRAYCEGKKRYEYFMKGK